MNLTQLPTISLIATNNETIHLHALQGLVVIYIYPMTSRPDTAQPERWDEIPGARGCTPQSCSFRDHYSELKKLHAKVYGLSAQTTDYQREVQERLHLPFELLSDTGLALKKLLKLPTFEVAGMELYNRMTLIARDGNIEKVFYPIVSPSTNAEEVIQWLRLNL